MGGLPPRPAITIFINLGDDHSRKFVSIQPFKVRIRPVKLMVIGNKWSIEGKW